VAHPDESRRAVRAAFVFEQQGLEVAALRHAIPLATARRWKAEAKAEGDDWDKARSAQMIAGGGMEDVARQTLGVIVRQVQATLDSIEADTKLSAADKVKLLTSLADSYNKLMATSKRLMPETDKLAVAADVQRRLIDYLKDMAPQLVAALVPHLQPFSEQLARDYGNKQA
jgi:hypothetical protein